MTLVSLEIRQLDAGWTGATDCAYARQPPGADSWIEKSALLRELSWAREVLF